MKMWIKQTKKTQPSECEFSSSLWKYAGLCKTKLCVS